MLHAGFLHTGDQNPFRISPEHLYHVRFGRVTTVTPSLKIGRYSEDYSFSVIDLMKDFKLYQVETDTGGCSMKLIRSSVAGFITCFNPKFFRPFSPYFIKWHLLERNGGICYIWNQAFKLHRSLKTLSKPEIAIKCRKGWTQSLNKVKEMK